MKLKKLSIALIGCLLITSLLGGGTAYAQDEELPDPGITPDSPFYVFDKWGKTIGLFFAFGPETKARKALEYAEERLAEARVMAAKNKARELKQATVSYDEFLALVNEKAEEARQQGASDNISETVALATSKHLSVLDRVMDQVPEEAREAIAQAREASKNGQKNALRALAKVKPERAIDINLAAIDSRLNRASVKATENVTEEVDEAVDDTEELLEFGDEISDIARGLGKDTTAIEELLARATSRHLEVLARVYEKVPEQAKPAIEKAMANYVRNHERLVETLKKKGALGEIPEEAPIPERVRVKVKEKIKLRASVKTKAPKNEIEEAQEATEAALEAIAEVQEELAEIRAKAEEEDVILTTEILAKFESLLAGAKSAFAAENYKEAKRLAEQAEEVLEDIEEALEKLEEEKEEDKEASKEAIKRAEHKLREARADAAEAIEEAQEELAELQARAKEVGVTFATDTLSRFNHLLSKAKSAFEAEKYQEAKSLAEQAEDSLEEVEKLIEKLKEDKEEPEEQSSGNNISGELVN